MGEMAQEALKLRFDRRLRLEFPEAKTLLGFALFRSLDSKRLQ